MKKPHVLLVDDDPNVSRAIRRLFEGNGIETTCVPSGEAALGRMNEGFSMVLLDVALQNMDGFEVLRQIRKLGLSTPVMMLSGNREDISKVRALGLGADSYIEKPFIPHVMLSQVKAMLRRAQMDAQGRRSTVLSGFRFAAQENRLYKGTVPLQLTEREKTLLLYFLDLPLTVITPDEIDANVWRNAAVNDAAIARTVSNLRKKIEDDPANPVYLQTVRGVGYRFVPNATASNPF